MFHSIRRLVAPAVPALACAPAVFSVNSLLRRRLSPSPTPLFSSWDTFKVSLVVRIYNGGRPSSTAASPVIVRGAISPSSATVTSATRSALSTNVWSVVFCVNCRSKLYRWGIDGSTVKAYSNQKQHRHCCPSTPDKVERKTKEKGS